MGAAESNPVRNLDKRTARRQYKDAFSRVIHGYRDADAARYDEMGGVETNPSGVSSSRPVQVFVRKRPIFQRELKASEFDVVTCGVDGRKCTIHDARMHADMRRRFVTHHEFKFDRVFNAKASNELVFREAADHLVDAVIEGNFTTCMMYGQTGSGKTYTMSALYEQASVALFQRLAATKEGLEGHVVSVSFVEIAGDSCHDLLNRFADAPLLTSKDGLVWPYPVVEITVSSAHDLISFVKFGAGVRTTEATGVHDASSRSHAILRIYVRKRTPGAPRSKSRAQRVAEATQRMGSRAHMSGRMAINYDDVPVGPGGAANFEGVLSLVDLAGSEKNIDSMYHSAQRRKEGAQINASLMALKSCVRARAAGKNRSHVYRKSKLTMALKGSFILPTARTVIIATVSPSSKDTEHSLNTLKHACIMDVNEGAKQSDATGQPADRQGMSTSGVRSWTQEISPINVTREARILKAKNGRGGLESNGNDGFQKDAGGAPLTAKEIRRQRIAAERRALSILSAEQREILKVSRTQLGNNAIDDAQQHRLQRSLSPYPQHPEQIEVQKKREERRKTYVAPRKLDNRITNAFIASTSPKRIPFRDPLSKREREGNRTYTQEQIDALYRKLQSPDLVDSEERRHLQLQLSHALACMAQQEQDESAHGFAVNNNMMPTSPARPKRGTSLRADSSSEQRRIQNQFRGDQDTKDDVSGIIAGNLGRGGSRGPRGRARRRQARPPQINDTQDNTTKKSKSRGEMVREARRRKIAQEQAERKAAIERKKKLGSRALNSGDEVARIEVELKRSDLSNAAKQGLKKQLAKLKASAIREQRKREQEEREAARREKERKQALKRKAAKAEWEASIAAIEQRLDVSTDALDEAQQQQQLNTIQKDTLLPNHATDSHQWQSFQPPAPHHQQNVAYSQEQSFVYAKRAAHVSNIQTSSPFATMDNFDSFHPGGHVYDKRNSDM